MSGAILLHGAAVWATRRPGAGSQRSERALLETVHQEAFPQEGETCCHVISMVSPRHGQRSSVFLLMQHGAWRADVLALVCRVKMFCSNFVHFCKPPLSHTDSQRKGGQPDGLSGSHELWRQFVSASDSSIALFLSSFLTSPAALSVCLSVGCMKNRFWRPAVWTRGSSPARVQMKRSALLDPACVRAWRTRTAPPAGYTPASLWDNALMFSDSPSHLISVESHVSVPGRPRLWRSPPLWQEGSTFRRTLWRLPSPRPWTVSGDFTRCCRGPNRGRALS